MILLGMILIMHITVMLLPAEGLLASIPPAASMLLILTAVYGIIFAAKQSPWLSPYLTGWVSLLFNVLLTVLGLIVVLPADQLYTWSGLTRIIISVLGSSGIHGMTQNIPPTLPPPVVSAPPSTPTIASK